MQVLLKSVLKHFCHLSQLAVPHLSLNSTHAQQSIFCPCGWQIVLQPEFKAPAFPEGKAPA